MPMHDWTRVIPGTYHAFHYQWIGALANALNGGGLPPGYFAMPEQCVGGPEPDVLTLGRPGTAPPSNGGGGIGVQIAPPRTRFVMESDRSNYARRANHLAIRHDEGEVVAIIEIVSPGNKDSRHAIHSFVEKAVEYLEGGVHLLIVDPFPPTRRDPEGIHGAIWGEFEDAPFELPPDKRLTCVSYVAGGKTVAFVEPIAVGDPLPNMPLYLTQSQYVWCPLEATYQATWALFPQVLKGPLEGAAPT